jgi:hypothetical protein
VIVGYGRGNPPSTPLTIEGADRVQERLRDVFDRENEQERAGLPVPSWPACDCTSRRLSNEVIGDSRFSYMETYSVGARITCVAVVTAELRDGRIVRETIVETLD